MRAQYRPLSYTPIVRANVFGQITSAAKTEPTPEPTEEFQDEEGNVDLSKITKDNDPDLAKFMAERAEAKQIKLADYVHPLKLALFNKVVEQHGFYKDGQVVKHDDGKLYKLNLTPKEIEILEPSIYVESYRIKSSMKKATQVNRFVRGYDVKTAINQLHFNPKKMSTELEKLLKRGLEQAREAGLNEDELFIQQLWTGSDGRWKKRFDPKGRGRAGRMSHSYIHVKCILKTNQTKLRWEWEKQQRHLAKKVDTPLNNQPLNFSVRPIYKW